MQFVRHRVYFVCIAACGCSAWTHTQSPQSYYANIVFLLFCFKHERMWDVTATPEMEYEKRWTLHHRMERRLEMRLHCVLDEAQQQQKRWNKKVRTKQYVLLLVFGQCNRRYCFFLSWIFNQWKRVREKESAERKRNMI